jgi:hypothetical protein
LDILINPCPWAGDTRINKEKRQTKKNKLRKINLEK